MINVNGNKFSEDEVHVATILSWDGVARASDFSYGKGRHIKKHNTNTSFSNEVDKEDIIMRPNRFPKYVFNFAKKNNRVIKIVYATNRRLINKIVKESKIRYSAQLEKSKVK